MAAQPIPERVPMIGLSLVCGRYDRTAALLDGRTTIEGCNVTAVSLTPEETFFRVFTQHEFDVAELSFSTYLMQTARGECQYIAIPAFVSRAFRHSGFYVRSDRISDPADLRGKRVGVPEYQVTAAVWGRGILQHEYGVPPSDIRWIVGAWNNLGATKKCLLARRRACTLSQLTKCRCHSSWRKVRSTPFLRLVRHLAFKIRPPT